MEHNTELDLTQILPLVIALTRKYTSNESTSVPYKTAEMLMEAVIYTVSETTEENDLPVHDTTIDVSKLYARGKEIIKDKLNNAKERYEKIVNPFVDYGCRNYYDTVFRGILGFFKQYDPLYQPQNHILTLDYPVLKNLGERSGIDLIDTYLAYVEKESIFLSKFSPNHISHLLETIMPSYKELYMDNICEPVLLRLIGCFICDRSVLELRLEQIDVDLIRDFFQHDTLDTLSVKVENILKIILTRIGEDLDIMYFTNHADEISTRIYNGMINGSLQTVFNIL